MTEEISELNSSERELGINLFQISKDSLYRYNLVRDYLKKSPFNKHKKCLDIFCGNGYGSYFIAKFIHNIHVEAVDGSKDVIHQAELYYKLKNISYFSKIYPFKLNKNKYEIITCFESLEHILDGEKLLINIYESLKDNGLLFLSTPNNNVLNYEKCLTKFHKKHYTRSELSKILKDIGFTIEKEFGQDIFELDKNGFIVKKLKPEDRKINNDLNSQELIFVCRK